MTTHRSVQLVGVLVACAVTILAGACSPPELDPVGFEPPEPGTVFRYRDVANVILETDGIRTRYRDHLGREAERVGLFLTDDPANRAQVDTAALMSLWPLEVDKTAIVEIRRGEEVYEAEFSIPRVEPVETGFGMVDAIIVQSVVTPKLIRDPNTAQTVMNSWWYAPVVKGVVRFRTTYLAGPGQGTVIGDRLVEIMDEESYEEWRRENLPTPPSDSLTVISD